MNLIFAKSAFKHGLNEDDIRQAMSTCYKSVPVESRSGKLAYMGVGLINGQPCELIFNISYLAGYRIFHAMCPARKSYIEDIENIERKAKK